MACFDGATAVACVVTLPDVGRVTLTGREWSFTSRDGAEDGVVRVALDGGVATLVLDRPPRNALTSGFADAILEALAACHADARVRAVVLTGAGDSFSVGADLTRGPEALRDLLDADGADRPGYREPAGRVTAAMARLDVPVVAALGGDAVGGGATVALGADVRVATPETRIGFPFTRLGVCPEGASTYHLPRVVGAGRAADWLLSGRLVDAREAESAGFLASTMTRDHLLAWAQEWAGTVAARTSPTAVAATKALLRAAPADAGAASEAESRTIVELIRGPDCVEGVTVVPRAPPPALRPAGARGRAVTSPAAPVRRRPRDRRRQILAAAAARFWSLGYHQVGMADVATAVGIAPSALYRHVRGKEELLLAILDEHLTRIERLVEEPAGGDLVDGLAALTLERREFGLLWERESGHLPEEPRRAIRHRLRAVADVVAARCAEPDPATADLRAWAALAVVDSPSHHRYELDDARFRPLLAGAARAVLATPLPPATGPSADPARPGVLAPASRREALLAAATRLFGERGYPAVGLGDIGAAAGIAGPSVYRHFTTKPDLLLRTLHRGNEALWLGLHHALGRAATPRTPWRGSPPTTRPSSPTTPRSSASSSRRSSTCPPRAATSCGARSATTSPSGSRC